MISLKNGGNENYIEYVYLTNDLFLPNNQKILFGTKRSQKNFLKNYLIITTMVHTFHLSIL